MNTHRQWYFSILPAAAPLPAQVPSILNYQGRVSAQHPGIAGVPYYNVIAQEFREVFPDAVKSSGEKLAGGRDILQ